MQAEWDVIGRISWVQLVKKPKALLRQGQGKHSLRLLLTEQADEQFLVLHDR
jgi:hypothetical protein